MITGGCECGMVRFEVPSVRDTVTVCHCSQCRRTSGHIWASTNAARYEDVVFTADEGLEWYASSSFAKRGFCRSCGSSLFYRQNGEEGLAIAAGCIDDDSDLKIGRHIFVADKGRYYEIGDSAPQFDKN